MHVMSKIRVDLVAFGCVLPCFGGERSAGKTRTPALGILSDSCCGACLDVKTRPPQPISYSQLTYFWQFLEGGKFMVQYH